ncbi:MAG: hypothetical protein K5669_06330 [Lachnospiraceae bacterium]|nr:hypothetical protein [Lachnospiraceae bacterium]
MRKSFKTITAAALSVAMILAPTMTSFAADPTTTAASGNVLAYDVDTVIVPTALKLAVNPDGYDVNTKYVKVDTATVTKPVSGTKYYTLSEDVYTVASVTEWAQNTTYYTATTSNNQIISLNYGLASQATDDKVVKVSFGVTADSNVKFVDTSAKATGAESGELAIYLGVAPAAKDATLTVDEYYFITKDKAIDESKTYYTVADGVYSAVQSPVVGSIGSYYEKSTTIGPNTTAAMLADVTMTASETPVVFATGTASSSADIGFKLAKATYAIKDDKFIDFATANLSDVLELSTIGGSAGFTFTGAMNPNADWANITTKSITITPTYTFTDATGSETAITTGLNQVETTAPAPSATMTAAGLVTIANATCTSSELKTITISSGTESYSVDSTTATFADPSSGTITIQLADGWLTSWTGKAVTIKVVLKDDTEVTATATFS